MLLADWGLARGPFLVAMDKPEPRTKGGKMDHSLAVKVARSGEGAIIAELLRLSHELQTAQERIDRLTEIIEQEQNC